LCFFSSFCSAFFSGPCFVSEHVHWGVLCRSIPLHRLLVIQVFVTVLLFDRLSPPRVIICLFFRVESMRVSVSPDPFLALWAFRTGVFPIDGAGQVCPYPGLYPFGRFSGPFGKGFFSEITYALAAPPSRLAHPFLRKTMPLICP